MVYVPPQANATVAMETLHRSIIQELSAHLDFVVIVVIDLNHANLKSVLPRFFNYEDTNEGK